ncbi:AAA family ATPase [Dehalogenimonas etheniformans]|uniref:Dephospho-CoA kinase n=1 Tax=Dehalogenimonas etheniformans TaxID=1536648 RepID=A0A2P5P6X3_9CHLR|nr:AAA family ATPase [Dehalogenimonas etheniformans]PPD58044.1 dephospho-CoA kinase [Dehalogenimonas etheniformans]QNT75394.1 AAA family ATPase [Dehalogenimonas etheniformans]
MSTPKIIAMVGMAGAGKTAASKMFESHGYTRIRFGDVTDEEVKKRGLPLNEANERAVREALRSELGMAAYAKLNLPRIDEALKKGPVVIDGMYSWEEYLFLKERYGDNLAVAAVWASPTTRAQRLSTRAVRPLTREETFSRDKSEIEKVSKAGPVAVADYMVVNGGSFEELRAQVEQLMHQLDENAGNNTFG